MSNDNGKIAKQQSVNPKYEIFTKNSKETDIQISHKDIKPIPNGSDKK